MNWSNNPLFKLITAHSNRHNVFDIASILLSIIKKGLTDKIQKHRDTGRKDSEVCVSYISVAVL